MSPKPFKLTGVVTKVAWANPHTFFYVDVTDDKTGKVCELVDGNGQSQRADARGLDAQHDEGRRRTVSIEGSLARDRGAHGNARVVVLVATGQRLFAGSSQGQP